MDRLVMVRGRRAWLGLCIALVGGCSAGTARSKPGRKRAKGPQTMTGLLVDGYIADLGGADRQKRIAAARELGTLRSEARKALPALEKLATGKDKDVRDAATRAIEEIRR